MAVQPEILDAYDDRELVAAFQAGEEDAFNQIVAVHYPSLLAEARRRLRSMGDAEDAVQETLLRAYLALERFGGDFKLRAWLSRILANTCADAASRRAGELRLFDRLASRREDVAPADEEVGDGELRAIVKDAVDALPESYRVAFVLREVEKRPYAEVAQTMAVTEPNARARVHRARNVLQERIRNSGATLGGFLIPLRLLLPRCLSHRRKTGMSSGQASLSAGDCVSQAPQLSQALAQAAATPLSQTVMAVAPDAGRSALPVASALATLAAAGAALIAPGGATVTPAASPGIGAGAVSVATANALSAFTQPTIQGDKSTSSALVAPASSAQSSSNESTGGTTPLSSTVSFPVSSAALSVAPGGASQWQWVGSAATALLGSSSGVSSTVSSSSSSPALSSSTSSSSSPASSSPTTPTTPTSDTGSSGASGATSIACPWVSSFPGATPAPVSAPPPIPTGATPLGFFASSTLTVSSTSPDFEANGAGNATNYAGADAVLNSLVGACLPGTEPPMLVVNLTNPSDPSANIFQLSATLVGNSTTGTESQALYRGTGQWLDGPDASETPVSLVADVVTAPLGGGSEMANVLVAFFSPVNDLLDPQTTSTPSGATSSASGCSSTCSDSPAGNSTPATGTEAATGTSTTSGSSDSTASSSSPETGSAADTSPSTGTSSADSNSNTSESTGSCPSGSSEQSSQGGSDTSDVTGTVSAATSAATDPETASNSAAQSCS
jgi:RNA polymerase sigma factor (sigma-70 family)